MKILLLGKNGQIGWELQRSLSPLGVVVALGRDQANFEDPESLRRIIQEIQPTIIVNAVAYTAVDKAESEPDKVDLINVVSVQVLAEEAKKLDAWLVHYSTDYVFDGHKKAAYVENDVTNPLSVYGRSKRNGELAIQHHHDKFLIFRTSWVFGIHGNNFVKTMLRLADEKEVLSIVSDQYGAPTSAAYVADITALALYRVVTSNKKTLCGLYHLVSGGKTSWYTYASYIFAKIRSKGGVLKVSQIYPVSSSEYKVAAARPCNSSLDTAKLLTAFGVYQPSWQEQVDHFLDNLRK